ALRGTLRRDRLPPDDRARGEPEGRARPLPFAAAPRRRRVRLDSEPAHARPAGRGEVRQPVASARVPGGGVPRPVRVELRARRAGRRVPRAQADAARPRAAARLGRAASRARPDRALLRLVRAGDLGARLRRESGRSRPRARLPRRPSMSDRGELALVLHTHMPYVEGFGTWPFGEEWLWEAVATVYLPLLD